MRYWIAVFVVLTLFFGGWIVYRATRDDGPRMYNGAPDTIGKTAHPSLKHNHHHKAAHDIIVLDRFFDELRARVLRLEEECIMVRMPKE